VEQVRHEQAGTVGFGEKSYEDPEAAAQAIQVDRAFGA